MIFQKCKTTLAVKLNYEAWCWKNNAQYIINRNCLPPPSTPRAAGHNPADTTAAEPLEEPPVTLLVLYGFLVALQ